MTSRRRRTGQGHASESISSTDPLSTIPPTHPKHIAPTRTRARSTDGSDAQVESELDLDMDIAYPPTNLSSSSSPSLSSSVLSSSTSPTSTHPTFTHGPHLSQRGQELKTELTYSHLLPLLIPLLPLASSALRLPAAFLPDILQNLLLLWYMKQLITIPWRIYYALRRARSSSSTSSGVQGVEMLALAGTILGPILGTLLLQRTALLSGSSAFSVKLFLLASGIKPISHIFHLSTTTNTQQPLQNDPMPSSLSQEFLQGEGVEGKGRLAGGRSSLEEEQIEDLKVQIECLKVRMNEMEAQSVPRPELERSLDTLALAVRKQRRQTTRLDHELDAITSLAAPSLALAHKSRTPRSTAIGADPSKAVKSMLASVILLPWKIVSLPLVLGTQILGRFNVQRMQ